MATSVQEPGRIDIFIESPSKARKKVASGSVAWFAPGGTPDGVPTNTPEKWNILPLNKETGGPGYSLVVEYTPVGADGLDASDSSWQIPVRVNGQMEHIGNSVGPEGLGSDAFVVDKSFADVTTVAAQTITLVRYRAKEGQYFQVGGGRVLLSVEDDTA